MGYIHASRRNRCGADGVFAVRITFHSCCFWRWASMLPIFYTCQSIRIHWSWELPTNLSKPWNLPWWWYPNFVDIIVGTLCGLLSKEREFLHRKRERYPSLPCTTKISLERLSKKKKRWGDSPRNASFPNVSLTYSEKTWFWYTKKREVSNPRRMITVEKIYSGTGSTVWVCPDFTKERVTNVVEAR